MSDSLKPTRRRSLFKSRLAFEFLEDRAVPAAATYVAADASFLITNDTGAPGFSIGDTVTWNPGQPNQAANLIVGTDAFDTIQAAVNATDVGGTVNIAAGTYVENVNIGSQLTLLGAGDGTDPGSNTIIQSAAANTPVITLGTGGTSAIARMDIEGVRVTGTTGASGNSTNGISITGGAGFITLNDVAAVGNAGNGIAINSAGSFSDIQITNSIVDSNAGVGIRIPSAAVNSFTVDSTEVKDNGLEGLATNPGGTANIAITNVTISNSTFSGNDSSNDSTTQAIDLFAFGGNATFTNDTVDSSSAGHAIQIDGRNQSGPAGTISFNGLTITGHPGKSGLIIQNFPGQDLSTKLSFNNVDLSGVTPGAGWAQLVIDQDGPGAVNLGNTKVSALGFGNPAAIELTGAGGANAQSVQFVDGSGNPVTNNFTIEDSIVHALDTAGLGVVTWVAGNVYVTPNTLGIQAGINAAASGDTVNVEAGSYAENNAAIVIDHSVRLLGPNASINPNGGTRVGEAVITDTDATNAISIQGANLNVTIQGFKFDSTSAPLNAFSGGDSIQLLDNIFSNIQNHGIFLEAPNLIASNNLFTGGDFGGEDSIQIGVDPPSTSANVTITNNVWSGVNTSALNLSDVSGSVAGNQFDNIVDYGILVANGSGNLAITGNTFNGITSNDASVATYGAGVRFYQPAIVNPVMVTGNTFENSAIGVAFRAGGDITGMPITVQGNTFTNDTQAIYQDGAGTLDITGGNTFNGVVSTTATLPQLFAIEDLIHHATDEAGKGLVIVKSGNLFVTPTSGSIQRAIDAASSGDTVNVDSGTYAENVTIGLPISLAGATGNAADVQIAPTSGDGIDITSDGVTVSGVEVTGPANGIVSSGISDLTLTNVAANNSTSAGFMLAGLGKGDLTLSSISAAGNAGAGLNVSGFNTVNLTAPTLTGNGASSISGATTLNLTSATDSTPTTVTASGTSLTTGPTSAPANDAIALSGVGNVNLTGGSGIDTFQITPAAGVNFNITGSSPAGGASGDILDLTGATISGVSASPSATGFSGTATSTGNGDIDFSGIENFLPAATISGTIFNDLNGNGTQDTGEVGLSGQTVQATDGTNTFTATTDAMGNFSFTGLAPGSYQVTVTTPGGATVTTNPLNVTAGLGSTNALQNVGFQFTPAVAGTSTVSGVVFNDANTNGVQDSGELGVNGAIVFLDLNGDGKLDNSEPSTVTSTVGGVAGSYTLTSNQVGTTATVRVIGKTTNLVNSSTPSVVLTDSATETANVGVTVTATLPPQLPLVGETAVGVVQNGAASVNVYTDSGTLAYSIPISGSFPGGIRVAMGDVTGDGIPDVIVGSGPGVQASIIVFNGSTHEQIFQNNPFDTFTGGVFVATGDLTGDGVADIVVTPDQGGGPRVVVIRGGDFKTTMSFFGIADPNFRGGARAAVGDINGDGSPDLIVAAGFGGGPRVSIYNGAALATGTITNLVNDFFVFSDALRNGVFVAAGDVNGDGFADLVVGAGPGGGPEVMVLSGQSIMTDGIASALASPIQNFFGGDPGNRNGIHVAVKDLNGDGLADLVTGDGNSGQVTGYNGRDGTQEFQFSVADDNSAIDGVYVG